MREGDAVRVNTIFCDCCGAKITPGSDWTSLKISYAHNFDDNVSFDLCIGCTNDIIEKVKH